MAEGSSAFFREDRGWMYAGRRSRDSITPEWAEKTTEFVERAFRRVSPDRAARGVLCPCARCGNTRPRSKHDMLMHLCKNGFRPGYMVWVYHGESPSRRPLSDEQSNQNGDLEGEEDVELADFWGEEDEVSSKPQGAMKREIPLIQSYAYSRLRKEDQIEWDYQKYLWEKEKLRQQQDARERPAQVDNARLKKQHLAHEIVWSFIDYERLREQYHHYRLTYEKHHQYVIDYQEYKNSFMAAMHSRFTCGTPVPPTRPRPPQRAPLPTMSSLAELKPPVALHASGTSSSVTHCTSYASTSHQAIPVQAFCTSGSTGIDTRGLPDRASVSALETQREEQYLVDQAFDLFIEHHNLVAKTYDQHTTTYEDYYSSYMEAIYSHVDHGTPIPPLGPPPPLPTMLPPLPLLPPMDELMPPAACASGTRGSTALDAHLGGSSTPASHSPVTPRTGGASMSRSTP